MSNEEKDIVCELHKNLELGFRMLMAKFGQSVYWHIRRLVVSHDDAQDATQETFVRIFRSFSTQNPESSFKAWIFRIATNEALRIISRRKNMVCSIDDLAAGSAFLEADAYVDYSDLEAVKLQNAILQLPTKQQLAFNLRYYDDLSYEEIAEIAGCSPENAKVNYHLAKKKIIKFITSND